MVKIESRVMKVLEEYFQLLDKSLPDFIEYFYIVGSISLGEYFYGISDIDFICIVNENITENIMNLLKKIHKEVENKYPNMNLDGYYVIKKDLLLGEYFSYKFSKGKFKKYYYCSKNSINVYSFVNYGIRLRGRAIKKDKFLMDWNKAIENQKEILNYYWGSYLNGFKKVNMLKLEEVEYIVLSISRIYYTIRNKEIITKLGAGEYALRNLPEEYSKIINEAMRRRRNIYKSYYISKIQRQREALKYLRFIINECNKY